MTVTLVHFHICVVCLPVVVLWKQTSGHLLRSRCTCFSWRLQQCWISSAGGGGACGGSSLQEHNKIQLSCSSVNLKRFVLSTDARCTSVRLSPPLPALKKRCASTWVSFRVSSSVVLPLKEKKNNNLGKVSLCHNWIQVRISRREQKLKAPQLSALLQHWKYLLSEDIFKYCFPADIFAMKATILTQHSLIY